MADGESIIDDYELINCVATGNFTQVWEVAPQSGAGRFAMKLLLPRAFEDKEQVQILKREGRVCKALDHPNLVSFYDAVFDKQHGYIVMEFLRALNVKSQLGTDLLGLHVRFRKLVETLCQALGYMHGKGWLHCDIKPDNILFNKSSELRLIDFSLSTRKKVFGGKIKTIQGTRTYIAPETIKRRSPTPQTDMYSLGITLFEILTGAPPFVGASPKDLLSRHLSQAAPVPSSFNRNVTKDMDRFVKRLLAKNPKDRFKEMAEVAAEFRALQVFKEDVEEFAARTTEEARQKQMDSLDEASRKSSRNDARRSEEEQQDPELARARAEERRQQRAQKEKKRQQQQKQIASPPGTSTAPPAAGTAHPPGVVAGQPMPPGAYPPPYPAAPMPAAMQPGVPYPVPYYQPGFIPQPYPSGVAPQLPPGQYPGAPIQPPSSGVAPPVAPSGSPPPVPAAGTPVTLSPPSSQQPAPPQTNTPNRDQPASRPIQPPVAPEQNDDDLPLMEELPPIL